MADGAGGPAAFDGLPVVPRPLRMLVMHPEPAGARALAGDATAPGSLTPGFAGFTHVEVAAEVADRASAVETTATGLPDVVVIDLGPPERPGRETVAEIHRRYPAVAVVASLDRQPAGGDPPDADLFAAVQLGAASTVTPAERCRLGRIAAGSALGESHLTPAVAAALLREVERLTRHPESILAPPPELTAGETVVLEAVARGRGLDAIARDVGVPLAMIAVRVGAAVTRLQRAYHDDRLFRAL
jgi:DNA-binding NarL/FixJ family response regulator